MPETRYIEEYKDGVVVNKIPYEVSDEELEREKAEETISELSALADEDLKPPLVGKFLKALARLRR